MNGQCQLAAREDDKQVHVATTPRSQVFAGHSYSAINISGHALVHLGDQHYHFSPDDEVQRIASSLHFPEIHRRYECIEDAHSNTFEWIFKPPNWTQPAWSSYIEWLQDDNQVYWVSGKPGSGKSTLMKFLAGRTLTPNYEEQQKPVVLSFWFWEPGYELERSLNGCMRSLLWQLLQDDRTKSAALQRILPYANAMWTKQRLLNCLRATLRDISETPLLLFLDGLDEASKDAEILVQMIETLKCDAPTLKMCVSSRPEQLFVDGFSGCPNLRIQDLNAKDISLVIKEYFFDNPKVAKSLRDVDRRELASLEYSINKKAEGVFLWVNLAIRSLIRGMRNYDNIEILQHRLEELPGDLNELFDLMLRRQNTDIQYYAEYASLYLNLALHRTMGLIEFCLAINDNLRKQHLNPETGWDMSTVDTDLQCEQAIVWINARTAGLLEVRRHGRSYQKSVSNKPIYESLAQVLNKYGGCCVQFVHRTARTYILDTSIGRKLLSPLSNEPVRLRRMCFESRLVYEGVLENLPRLNITPGHFRDYFWGSFKAPCSCLPKACNEDYERICDGFLNAGHCRVDQFWWPGMAKAFPTSWQCPFPSSDHNTIDFCRLYCLFGLWDNAHEKMKKSENKLSIESLSILLVFVAYGQLTREEEIRRRGSDFFRSLIELGANPNHEITIHHGEKIWIFPYIVMWISEWTAKNVVATLLKAIPHPTFENLPTLSSCSESFWKADPWRRHLGTHLYFWGDYSLTDMAQILNIPEFLAQMDTTTSPSRIHVVCKECSSCGFPELYPISIADSAQLLAALRKDKDKHEEGPSDRVGRRKLYNCKYSSVGILHLKTSEGEQKASVQFVRDVQTRNAPFSSLLDACVFMGKPVKLIQNWPSQKRQCFGEAKVRTTLKYGSHGFLAQTQLQKRITSLETVAQVLVSIPYRQPDSNSLTPLDLHCQTHAQIVPILSEALGSEHEIATQTPEVPMANGDASPHLAQPCSGKMRESNSFAAREGKRMKT